MTELKDMTPEELISQYSEVCEKLTDDLWNKMNNPEHTATGNALRAELLREFRAYRAMKAKAEETYNAYKHLDALMSDPEWGKGSAISHVLRGVWEGVKALLASATPESEEK